MFRLSLIACCLLVLCSCRDEFTLEGDYQDIPVAYAFLNPDDDRHFVRVQKAFLQAGGNAEENAAIADSIYYGSGEASVFLENLTDSRITELERVNGEDFELNREDGVFATSPNILYTVLDSEFDLDGGDDVRLLITRPGQTDAVAETKIINSITINRPNEMVRIDDYERPLAMTWSKEVGAAIYDVTIFMDIRELFPADASRNRDVRLEWNLANSFVPGGDQTSDNLVRYDVLNESFYRFIGNALEPENGVVRRFQNFDLRISASGQAVLDRRLQENANAGLTSSQALSPYTNLTGGLGMITSTVSTLREDILIDGGSLDSLKDGIHTRTLGFR
ncbi:DUF4249 family protein [Neolewinella persica]|uniref:DUF4249 family protein n=1 Tax=Neolewinella persica TaxID=70998 RepID=UPI00037A1811|nr:DUF4249 family protein [Neolewinella persica]